mmetsp:Transcript_56467/g.91860  ORF Transcript_56467/g.91860 Transcript_56467/m.91860 type:complete len:294 (-) Transcript_56467:339-1220(-)
MGGGSSWHICWARAAVAVRGADAAASTFHFSLNLVALARRFLVVAAGRAWWRRRRRRRRRWPTARNHRVGGLGLDTTLTCTWLATLKLHKALLAPSGSPAVLHQPVVSAILSAIANHQNTMVQLGAASLGEDAALVQLKCHLISLNGHRHWLLGNCIHQSLLIIGLYVHIALDAMGRDTHSASRSFADAVLGSVGVAVLSANSGLLLIFEAVVHQSTAAALVSNQLLLRKRHQLARSNGPSALQSTSGAESPARSALLLVLHSCHGLAPPIHRLWQRRIAHLVDTTTWHVAPH